MVGLGNPGPAVRPHPAQHRLQRVDRLGERTGASFNKYDGRFAETRLGDARIGLLAPETFMNLSGPPVARGALLQARRRR